MAEYNIWRSPYSKVQLASAVGKNPIIQNEYWMVWDIDTMQYVNTGVKARGENGVPDYTSVPDGAVLKIVDGEPQWV